MAANLNQTFEPRSCFENSKDVLNKNKARKANLNAYKRVMNNNYSKVYWFQTRED